MQSDYTGCSQHISAFNPVAPVAVLVNEHGLRIHAANPVLPVMMYNQTITHHLVTLLRLTSPTLRFPPWRAGGWLASSHNVSRIQQPAVLVRVVLISHTRVRAHQAHPTTEERHYYCHSVKDNRVHHTVFSTDQAHNLLVVSCHNTTYD